MKALLFPGQGSQAVGMGAEFFKNFKIVKDIFLEADERLGFKISKIILDGPSDELKLTKNTQPAILTISYSIFSVMKKEFNFNFEKFKFFAGHSLGEYSALVAAESLKFSDAIKLLFLRGKAMQEAVPVGEGAMLAVLGIGNQELKKYIVEARKNGVCEIANDNAEGQIIMSGAKKSIEELQKILKKDKIKSIILPVSAPFHCSLMTSASKKMEGEINSTDFKTPVIDLVNNVTALKEKNPENIKNLLIKQIYSKVRWRESVIFMKNQGVKDFIEIGPGKVLSGLVKRITSECNTISLNSIEELKSLQNEFQR